MARLKNESGRNRSQYDRTESRTSYVYTDGNTVRKVHELPGERTKQQSLQGSTRRREAARAARTGINMSYVLFLTAVAVITVFMCVNYLKLQAQNTKLRQEVTSLQVELDAAKLENDSDYNRIMTEIDMEHVKDVAMNKLGMSYAKKGQIVTYSRNESDYVRQYQEVPEE
jgi:cell division protein FtsL